MKLRYKIVYEFDYPTNNVIIILQSPYFQKEYPAPNIGNLPAVLSLAIADFNEVNKLQIEELQNEETIENAKRKKSGKRHENEQS